MEVASKVFLGLLLLVVFGFVAGFIDVWCEQRKRDKEKKEREDAQAHKG